MLLVEPWLDGSHRRWAEGYVEAAAHEVHLIGLPGALWRWRLRGGALPLAERIDRWVEDNGQPDVLLISGLVDVAHLLALTRHRLDPVVAVVIYQHESQLVYPRPDSPKSGSLDQGAADEAALHNWLSWCVADRVLFNSGFHRDAVIAQLGPFLDRMPDDSHRFALDRVVDKFEVMPVGLDLSWCQTQSDHSDLGPVIVWPHRWEHDKNPAVFLRALDKLVDAGLAFQLVLAGEDPIGGSEPATTNRAMAEARFAQHLVAVGPFDVETFRRLLTQADIVVSCADHEFFGIGVVEAIAAGCVPLLPNALSYPGLLPSQWHHVGLYERGRFGTALVAAVDNHDARRDSCDGLAEAMLVFDWTSIGPRLDDALARAVVASSHRSKARG